MAPQCKTWPGRRSSQTLWWLRTRFNGHKQKCMMLHLRLQKLSSYCDSGQTLEQFSQRRKESAWAEIHGTQLDIAHAACWSSRVGLGDLQRPLSASLILCFCDSLFVSLYLPTSCHTTPSQSKYLFNLLLDANGQVKRFFLSHASAASAGNVSTGLVLLINFKAVLIHKFHYIKAARHTLEKDNITSPFYRSRKPIIIALFYLCKLQAGVLSCILVCPNSAGIYSSMTFSHSELLLFHIQFIQEKKASPGKVRCESSLQFLHCLICIFKQWHWPCLN